MHALRACALASVLALASAALAPGAALASPDTLRMATENLVEGPVDMVLAPVTAGRVLVHNADEVGLDPVGGPAYGVLGSVGMTVLHVSWGLLRTLSGAVLLVPGVLLFPFEGVDVPEEANVFQHGEALVEAGNPLAEDPPELKWIPPATPATIDAKLGIEVPYSRYPETRDVGAVYGDERSE